MGIYEFFSRLRQSGVLVEAFSSGILVVVRHGSSIEVSATILLSFARGP
jgi:hypothetical protein